MLVYSMSKQKKGKKVIAQEVFRSLLSVFFFYLEGGGGGGEESRNFSDGDEVEPLLASKLPK